MAVNDLPKEIPKRAVSKLATLSAQQGLVDAGVSPYAIKPAAISEFAKAAAESAGELWQVSALCYVEGYAIGLHSKAEREGEELPASHDDFIEMALSRMVDVIRQAYYSWDEA